MVAWIVLIKDKFDWGSLAFTLNFGGLCECRVFGTTAYLQHVKDMGIFIRIKILKSWNHNHFVFFIEDRIVKLLLS